MKNTSKDIFKIRKLYDATNPLLAATQAFFNYEDFAAQHKWGVKNPYERQKKGHLNIQVSSSQRERAMLIFATIISIADHFNYKVVTETNDTMNLKTYGAKEGTFVVVENEAIWIRLVEKSNASYTINEYGWRTQELKPSGLLRIEIERDRNLDYKLIDTPFASIEEKLEKIFTVLQQEAVVRKENRIKEEIEKKKRDEEERQRQEIMQIKDDEKQKIANLFTQSYYSDVADHLRKYADRMEQHSDDSQNIEWIRMIADCIDPLKDTKHPILSSSEILALLEIKESPIRYEVNTVYRPFFIRR